MELNKNKTISSFKDKYNGKKHILVPIFLVASLIILLISMIRVPYVGQFIDATIFSFLFGYAKYLIYIYLILIICLKLFKVKNNIFLTKRFLLFSFITTCFFSMMLGGIEILVNQSRSNLINFYINEYWVNYIWSFSFTKYPLFGLKGFIDGGLIGTLIASISGIFLIILAILLCLAIFLIIFKEPRRKIINQFWAFKNKLNKNKTAQPSINTTTTFNLNKSKDGIIDYEKQSYFNLDDKYKINDIDIKLLAKKLNDFLVDNKIQSSEVNYEEQEDFYYLYFNIDEQEYDKFNDIKSMLTMVFGDVEYSTIYTDEKVSIRFEKLSKKINEVLSSYLSINVKHENEYALCLTTEKKPVFLNFNGLNVIGVSNVHKKSLYFYINSLIAHLSINYKIEGLEVSILSPIAIHDKLLISQNASKTIYDDLSKVNLFVNNLYNEISQLDKIYETKKTMSFSNIARSNKDIKYRFIIIDNIVPIINGDKELFNKLKYLFDNATKYGLIFMVIDNTKGGMSFKEINYQVRLGFNMDQETSKEVFGTFNSKNLVLENNALLYIPSSNQKIQVLIPRMNVNELIFVRNKLISIFTDYKL